MLVLTPGEQFAQIPFSAVQSFAACTRAEILTFNALALHADPSGHCWPGRERLSLITGLPENRISKATTGLERKGLIRKDQNVPWRVDYYLLPQSPLPLSEPLPLGEPPPCQERHPMVPPAAPRTDQRTDQRTERAEAKPAPPEPAPVALLSQPMRMEKTLPPDSVPEDWIEAGKLLRPDLSEAVITQSAEKYLDYARGNGAMAADFLPHFRNWLRRERGPKETVKKLPTTDEPSRYAAWQPGQPQGAAPVSPEQAIAAFERDMERAGAMKGADGIWQRPIAQEVAPLPRPMIHLATVETPAPRVEKPRYSPLHGLLAGLRTPEAHKPASVPWQRRTAATVDPGELAKAEALLAEEVARRKEARYQRGTDSR